jgi:nitrile hydratase subunit beta
MASFPLGQPRFQAGDAIQVDTRPVVGHCRTPAYLRGKSGVIVETLGRYRDPERLAYHRPGYPAEVLYKVRFCQAEVWGRYAGPASDNLEADIYEGWLRRL